MAGSPARDHVFIALVLVIGRDGDFLARGQLEWVVRVLQEPCSDLRPLQNHYPCLLLGIWVRAQSSHFCLNHASFRPYEVGNDGGCMKSWRQCAICDSGFCRCLQMRHGRALLWALLEIPDWIPVACD